MQQQVVGHGSAATAEPSNYATTGGRVTQPATTKGNHAAANYASLGVVTHPSALSNTEQAAQPGGALLNQTQQMAAGSKTGASGNILSPAGRLTVIDQIQNRPLMAATGTLNMMNEGIATYQSLTAELEQENSALEDLHMYFVAFYKRQRRIIEMADRKNSSTLEGNKKAAAKLQQ